MLKFFSPSLSIDLSRTRLSVLQINAWPRNGSVIKADVQLPGDTVSQSEGLGDLLSSVLSQANCSGNAARFVLADELVRFFMVTPPQNPGKLHDFHAAAAMRFQTLFDEPASGWRISADWDARHAFLACAVPQALIAEIQRASEQRRIRIIEIAPYFISAANRWRKSLLPDAWFGAVRESTLSLGCIHQQRLHSVRCVTLPADAWINDRYLPELLKKEALRLNLPLPETIQLRGSFPGLWKTKNLGELTCIRLGQANSANEELDVPAKVTLATSLRAQ